MTSFLIVRKLNLIMTILLVFLKNSKEDDYFCGTIDVPLNPLLPQSRAVRHFGKLQFRLSVFYDESLFYKYGRNVSAMKEFIYRIVNSVNRSFRSSKMKERADITLDVKTIGLYHQRIENEGNGNNYRRDFCQFVKHVYPIDPSSLMASVLLTGHNFRSQNSKTSTTQGLAHINVACDWNKRSWGGVDPCVLVEARSFKAAFIMAHELGHTLGMNHDEILGCGSSSIMSMSTGDGKTQWSKCSLDQMSDYLSKLIQYNDWCLNPDHNPSYQEYFNYNQTTVDHQCKTSLGYYFQGYNDWTMNNDICYKIECSEGSVVVPIHPAIENTPCGKGMACREGSCKSN